MKITIIGSMNFAREMLEAEKALKALGHEVLVPLDVNECLENPGLAQDMEHCIRNNILEYHYNLVKESDAVLVVNHHKKGVDGYVGGNTLIEMGLAHFLGKKIFMLNSIPDLSYKVEIRLMNPIILDGDLGRIA
jgi:nucleoside 2-deoxyribosyltransferase